MSEERERVGLTGDVARRGGGAEMGAGGTKMRMKLGMSKERKAMLKRKMFSAATVLGHLGTRRPTQQELRDKGLRVPHKSLSGQRKDALESHTALTARALNNPNAVPNLPIVQKLHTRAVRMKASEGGLQEDADHSEAEEGGSKAETQPFRLGAPPTDRRYSLAGEAKQIEWLQSQNYVPGTPRGVTVKKEVRVVASGPGLKNNVTGIFSRVLLTVDLDSAEEAGLKINTKSFSVAVRRGPSPCETYVSRLGRGLFAMDWACSVSGKYELAINCFGTHIEGSPFHFFVRNAVTDIHKTYFSGGRAFIAGRQASFKINAVDQDGNARVKGGDDMQASFSGPCGVRKVAIVDSWKGKYTVNFTPLKVGEYSCDVSLGGQLLSASPYTFKVTSSLSHPTTTTISGAGASYSHAGDTSFFTITTHDCNHNPTGTGGDKITGFLSHNEANGLTVPLEIGDNGDGTYTATYMAGVSGKYDIRLNLEGQRCFPPRFHTLKVVTSGVKAHNCYIVQEEKQKTHLDLLTKNSGTVTQRKRDLRPVETSLEVGSELKLFLSSCDQHGNVLRFSRMEKFTCIVTDKTSGETRDDSENMEYTAEGWCFTFKSKKATTYSISIQLGGQDLRNSPAEVSMMPGALAPDKCTISTMGYREAVAGTEMNFVLEGRDMYGNKLLEGGSDITFELLAKEGPNRIAGLATDSRDGSYQCTCTPEKAGLYRLKLMCDGVPLGNMDYEVTVLPQPMIRYCILEGASCSEVTPVTVGVESRFLLMPVDRFGNKQTDRVGERFIVELELDEIDPGTRAMHDVDGHKVSDTYRSLSSAVEEVGSGAYEVRFCPFVAGTYRIKVYLWKNAVNFKGRLRKVTSDGIEWCDLPILGESNDVLHTKAGTICGKMCVAGGSGAFEATAGKEGRFIIYAADEFRNRIYHGGHNFGFEGYVEFLPPEVEEDIFLEMTTTDQEDGTYAVTYVGEKAENYVIEVTLDNVLIPEIRLNPEIKPFITDKSSCTISKDFAFSSTAGKVSTVNLEARDKFGNLQNHGDDNFSITLAPKFQHKKIHARGEYISSGTYRHRFVPHQAGTYTLFAMCVPNSSPVENESKTFFKGDIVVHPGAPSTGETMASGQGLKGTCCGVPGIVEIDVRDRYKNPAPVDNIELAANLLDSDGRSVGSTTCYQRAPGSSIWAVSYRVSEKGDFVLHVCLGGKDIQGSPFKVEVRKEEMPRQDLEPAHHIVSGFSSGGSFNWDPDTEKYWKKTHNDSKIDAVHLRAVPDDAPAGAGRSAVAFLQETSSEDYQARIEGQDKYSRHLQRKRATMLHWKIHGLQKSYDLKLLDEVGHPRMRRRSIDVACPEVIGRSVKVPPEQYAEEQRYLARIGIREP